MFAFGIREDDVYGREMLRQLNILGIDCSGLLIQRTGWSTNTYVKPYSDLREEPRIDIGNFNIPDRDISEEILAKFETAVGNVQ